VQDSRADELRASLTVLNVDFVLAVVVGAFVQLPESHPVQDDIAATEDGIAAAPAFVIALEEYSANRIRTITDATITHLDAGVIEKHVGIALDAEDRNEITRAIDENIGIIELPIVPTATDANEDQTISVGVGEGFVRARISTAPLGDKLDDVGATPVLVVAVLDIVAQSAFMRGVLDKRLPRLEFVLQAIEVHPGLDADIGVVEVSLGRTRWITVGEIRSTGNALKRIARLRCDNADPGERGIEDSQVGIKVGIGRRHASARTGQGDIARPIVVFCRCNLIPRDRMHQISLIAVGSPTLIKHALEVRKRSSCAAASPGR
jgi:hypothetical protein